MSKILITGALGHIGSKFIHSLSADEFELVCMMDNFFTQRYSSLFNLPQGVKFSFIEESICTADLDKYFRGIDVVIHLAAITDATFSLDKKDEVTKVNYLGTERIAEACIRNDCKLIFPSTTSIYGVQTGIVDEECGQVDLKPQSPYAESKIQAEQLLENLGRNKGLQYVICRFGTIFGTSIGMRFHTAVNKFCWQASMGQPITVWKTALNQKRPYLGLGDAINALKFIINKNLFDNGIYNIVTTNTTVEEIINDIKVYIPDLNIKMVDSKIMNQLSYHVSSTKFEKVGFLSKDKIINGIEETIILLKNAH